MSAKSHPSYDVSVVAPALESLHEHVTATKSRIEITRPGTDECCVLISAEELASLERALEIFSETAEYHAIADHIAAVAAAAEPTTCAS
jgi:PHD/YefM family antitoxin component YafN of YafNO toxin-antitoxin module